MDVEDLFVTLELPPSPDLRDTLTGFVLEGGQPDVDRMLTHLYEKKLLSRERYVEAHARQGIDVDASTQRKTARAYTLLGNVGEGAMGEVFVARDNELRRKVAYKRLKVEVAAKPRSLKRFLDEAQITAQLEHPHIIPVYSIQATSGKAPAFAMKLVRGDTLEQLTARCRRILDAGKELEEGLSLPARLDHFLKTCDAMAYAHAKGVVHRDLKPANIMVGTWGEVYVMDWGLAKVMGGREHEVTLSAAEALRDEAIHPDTFRTRHGQVIGTLAYMSPEQARGEHATLDGRSDEFALGVVLLELVALGEVYQGVDSASVFLAKLMAGDLGKDMEHYSGETIPQELRAIVSKATASDRDDRYPSVDELADDVRRFLRGEEVAARPDNAVQALVRWTKRHLPLTLSAALAALLLLVGLVAWSTYARQRAEAQANVRELRLTRFQTAIAEEAHRIDRRFLKFEGRLRALAAGAIQALTEGTPSDEPLHENQTFRSLDTAPFDTVLAPLYGKLVSVDWPVYKLAPGVTLEEVRPLLRRLTPIRHLYKRLFVHSARADAPLVDSAKALELLTERGGPLRWAYVGLVEGVMFSYPGKFGYPPEYDPRVRPWYRLAERKHGVFWGNHYIDLQGQGLILPCTTSMYDARGVFLGVAGIELTFDYVIKELMDVALPAVQETFLLDATGRVVVRSSELAQEFASGELHDAREEPLHPIAEVVAAVAEGRTGLVEVPTADPPLLVTLNRLETLGWYYVAHAEVGRLFE